MLVPDGGSLQMEGPHAFVVNPLWLQHSVDQGGRATVSWYRVQGLSSCFSRYTGGIMSHCSHFYAFPSVFLLAYCYYLVSYSHTAGVHSGGILRRLDWRWGCGS